MHGALVPVFIALVMCVSGCRRGAGDPTTGQAALDTSCRVDGDCAIDHGLGCCGYLCGDPPPWAAVNRKAYEQAAAQMRRACEDRDERCPVASCLKWPDCRTEPRAYCDGGRCATRIVTTEACGAGACPASCGPQPAPVAPSQDCAQAAHDAWALCCCRGAGGAAAVCEELKEHACRSARNCAASSDGPGDAGMAMPGGCE